MTLLGPHIIPATLAAFTDGLRCWNFDYGRYKYTGLRQGRCAACLQLREMESDDVNLWEHHGDQWDPLLCPWCIVNL